MRERQLLSQSVIIVLIAAWTVLAQSPKPTPTPECSVVVYNSKELDRKVKVLEYPAPHFDAHEIATHSPSTVVLRAIFCGSGKVTDIKVQRSVSQSLDDEAIRTAKTIRFRPAEKDGKPVSQWMTLEYHIND
jgi:TonB family protein